MQNLAYSGLANTTGTNFPGFAHSPDPKASVNNGGFNRSGDLILISSLELRTCGDSRKLSLGWGGI
jgi:hypothetical protein